MEDGRSDRVRKGHKQAHAVTPSVLIHEDGRAYREEKRYVERLVREYGWDAKLTDLLPALVADCPKRRSVNIYDRCKAVFEKRG